MSKVMKKDKRQQKKQKKRANRVSVPSTICPRSRFLRVYMGYVHGGTLTEPAASTGAIYQYRLNSVYDPDYSGTGLVAQGYTAYTGLYGLFRVTRARAIVRFYSGTSGNMTVGVVPGLNSTVTSSFGQLQNQPFARSRNLQGNAGGEWSAHEFDYTVDLPLVAGVTRSQFMNDFDFSHGIGANPVRSIYLTLFLSGSSAVVQSVGYTIRLVYDVELSQPLDTVIN